MKTLYVGNSASNTTEQKTWLSWTNDGHDASVNSLQILLDWLTTPGNYNRFTGGSGGETRQAVVKEIQDKITEARIVSFRSIDSIVSKIKEIVSSYKRAHQIKNQTGQSMDNVYAACKHWDILDPILGCRPSVQPLFTNKQNVVDITSPTVDCTPACHNRKKSVSHNSSNEDSNVEDALITTAKSSNDNKSSAQQVCYIVYFFSPYISICLCICCNFLQYRV
jgi:hypothetical protein